MKLVYRPVPRLCRLGNVNKFFTRLNSGLFHSRYFFPVIKIANKLSTRLFAGFSYQKKEGKIFPSIARDGFLEAKRRVKRAFGWAAQQGVTRAFGAWC
jgi:hypothetical protein